MDASLAQLDRVTGYEPVGRGFESLLAHQIRSVILIQSHASFSMSKNTMLWDFFKKEKFQSNGCFAKIRAFSATAHKFRSLRNFSSKNNAPIIVFLP